MDQALAKKRALEAIIQLMDSANGDRLKGLKAAADAPKPDAKAVVVEGSPEEEAAETAAEEAAEPKDQTDEERLKRLARR